MAGMYGKHFQSMYTGSMVGSGALVFAVMGYVIANAVPDRKVGTQVELNPRLLKAILGEPEDAIVRAIEFLCSPDPQSRTKEEEGRRLVRLGQFDYRVVNGEKYRAIRDEETRRQQNRDAQARHRAKSKPSGRETRFAAAVGAGDDDGADRIAAEGLDEKSGLVYLTNPKT